MAVLNSVTKACPLGQGYVALDIIKWLTQLLKSALKAREMLLLPSLIASGHRVDHSTAMMYLVPSLGGSVPEVRGAKVYNGRFTVLLSVEFSFILKEQQWLDSPH